MREVILHLSWLITHFVRTHWESKSGEQLIVGLAEEVKVLQAELHRAHRILEGYSVISDREEQINQFRFQGNIVFLVVTLILVGALVFNCRTRRVVKKPGLSIGDTGGSSSSDSDLGTDQNPEGKSEFPSIPEIIRRGTGRAGGPTRPSSFGRGRRELRNNGGSR